jgi:hypothetical protein
MRPDGRTSSKWMLMVLVALIIGGGIVVQRPVAAQSGAVVPMLPSDRIVRSSRGSAATTLSFAAHYGATRYSDVAAYVNEVYRLAPQVGIDPAIVVAQSALETDTWRTSYWQNNLNPAGIGITYNGQASFTWGSGTDAARGQLVHLYLYAVGEISARHVLAPYVSLDPRYQAAVDAGYAGIALTIAALTGRWATDPVYGEKLAGRGNDQLVRYRIAAVSQSANSSSAWLADDANAYTAWQTTAGYPRLGSATYDLGAVRSLGLVRWLYLESGYADTMYLQISNDGASWQTILPSGNGDALRWQGLTLNRSARYVRSVFTNPNGDAKLGSLAEVQFWPPTTSALPFVSYAAPAPITRATPTPTPSPTTAPAPAPTATPVIAPPTSTPVIVPPTATSASRTIRGGGGSAPAPPPAATATTSAPAPNPPAATAAAPTATPASRSIRR